MVYRYCTAHWRDGNLEAGEHFGEEQYSKKTVCNNDMSNVDRSSAGVAKNCVVFNRTRRYGRTVHKTKIYLCNTAENCVQERTTCAESKQRNSAHLRRHFHE